MQLSFVTRSPLCWSTLGWHWLALISPAPLFFSPSLCSAGPHPGTLPARFQQQPFLHHLLHALLTGPTAATQCNAPIPPAPLPAVPAPAEAVQLARYNAGLPMGCLVRGAHALGCSQGRDLLHLLACLDLPWDGEKLEAEMSSKDEFRIIQVGSELGSL